MPLKKQYFGCKSCLECGSVIIHKIKRDIERKKFCSRKCSSTYHGKKRPLEHFKKMWEKGCTPENNAKKVHRGEKHPLYIKDRSKVKSKRPQFENRKWVKEILKRDNYTCQMCNEVGGKLQADHIKPYSLCEEYEKWDLENGRTLCVKCHKNTPTYGGKMKTILKKLKPEVGYPEQE